MLAFHPLADIFPLIEGADFADLAADVKQNGLRERIVVLDGAILDGRNRYRAALAAGLLDDDDGPERSSFFSRFVAQVDGDPLAFVISKNLRRRHLNERQRASAAAKIATLSRGRPVEASAETSAENPPIGGISVEQAAAALNVAPRQVERARVVHEQGVPELRQALDRGQVAVSVAEQIARLPEAEQRPEAERRGVIPSGARAIMASRAEPDDSLDFFPTPPFATRALIEDVFPRLGAWLQQRGVVSSVWEPACGEGHIAEVLREYFDVVHASDVHDYGYDGAVCRDFLAADATNAPIVDWIVTNPPFDDKALAFVERALDLAPNVAMFFRTQWAVEGVERFERLFRDRPPTLHAYFVERVNLCKGRWDPDGTTATAYCWLVWMRGREPLPPFYIPPGRRKARERDGDRERFTAHPVIALSADEMAALRAARAALPPHDPETGEIVDVSPLHAGRGEVDAERSDAAGEGVSSERPSPRPSPRKRGEGEDASFAVYEEAERGPDAQTAVVDDATLALLEAVNDGRGVGGFSEAIVARAYTARFVAGKKTPRLTRAGEDELAGLWRDRQFRDKLAALPDDVAALTGLYRAALERRHAAIVGAPAHTLGSDAEVEEGELIDLLLAKANGGTEFGMNCDDSPAEALRAAAAAPLGETPMWGQRGLFRIDVDGLPAIVAHDEHLSFAAFAVAPDRPFISPTGFCSGLSTSRDPDYGCTVVEAAAGLIRDAIADAATPRKKGKRDEFAGLALPAATFRLPDSWAGGLPLCEPIEVAREGGEKKPPAAAPPPLDIPAFLKRNADNVAPWMAGAPASDASGQRGEQEDV